MSSQLPPHGPQSLPRHQQLWGWQGGPGVGNKAPAGSRTHLPSPDFFPTGFHYRSKIWKTCQRRWCKGKRWTFWGKKSLKMGLYLLPHSAAESMGSIFVPQFPHSKNKPHNVLFPHLESQRLELSSQITESKHQPSPARATTAPCP